MIQIKKIRGARLADLAQVINLDARITGLRKPAYWSGVLKRYGGRGPGRYFYVSIENKRIQGYVVGEIRDWEFGSPPCGWVFGIGVRPEARLGGTGTQLLDRICGEFRRRGVNKVRTLLARENALILAFFRSQGMMAAPYIPLERDL